MMKRTFVSLLLVFTVYCVIAQPDNNIDRIENRIDALDNKINTINQSTVLTNKQLDYIRFNQENMKDTLLTKYNINEKMLYESHDSLQHLKQRMEKLHTSTSDQLAVINGKFCQFRQYALFFAIGILVLFAGLFFWMRYIIKKQSLLINKHIMSLRDQNLSFLEDLQGQLKAKAGDIKDTIKKREKKTRKIIKKGR